ncbi:hypothetical protein H9643_18245 [Ochrobactrum sp. Sa2BUA5]|uniref:hypothetical protein n=1 Tax=Ochrobactrum quorumnocens TaxID=271865 RepID=UPI00178495E8|nr:hypothetical protein [[Ochrobactrum] quorumnocens]MBD7992722.1 hypothetical protein [Ochrobactrum gallinarum]
MTNKRPGKGGVGQNHDQGGKPACMGSVFTVCEKATGVQPASYAPVAQSVPDDPARRRV